MRRRTTLVLSAGVGAMVAIVPAAPPPAGGAGGAVATVMPFTYSPDPVEITRGDSLTFYNADGASGEGHSLTHATPSGRGERFQSIIVPPGEHAAVNNVEKLAAGEYPFTCRVHPFMRGALVVE
ncbi:MAG: cupredoxin domain-containing protein [Acidimicrobiia bacterium]